MQFTQVKVDRPIRPRYRPVFANPIYPHFNKIPCFVSTSAILMNNAYNKKILLNWSLWRYWIYKTCFITLSKFHFRRKTFFWKYLAFYDKNIVKYDVKFGHQMSLLTRFNVPLTAWKPVTGPLQARNRFWARNAPVTSPSKPSIFTCVYDVLWLRW